MGLKGCQGRSSAHVFVVVLALLGAMEGATAMTTFIVGGSAKWDLGVNYTKWGAGNNYHINDVLSFVYSAKEHNVFEVSESDYETCTTTSPIKEYVSGNDLVTILAPHQFFICGVLGHCGFGMKVAVTVLPTVTPPPTFLPSPSPPPAAAPPTAAPPSPTPAPALTAATPPPPLEAPAPYVSPSPAPSAPAISPPAPYAETYPEPSPAPYAETYPEPSPAPSSLPAIPTAAPPPTAVSPARAPPPPSGSGISLTRTAAIVWGAIFVSAIYLFV